MVASDIIAGLIVTILLASAIAYIVRAKLRGVKCIGCPVAGKCSSEQRSASTCGCPAAEKVVESMEKSIR